ncbi:MAG: ABC transporter ATP-binding protein [Candidatus Goldbacteria bacterium]|nr:ABC transporter ATP-binding protein [Candidatus Goldiibacteriota bacterium]
MDTIKTENVKKTYTLGKTLVPALNGIDLTIKQGEFTCVVGPSGSGKTTLLNIIGCLDTPSEGTAILFEKYDVSKLNDSEATKLRRDKIGFIFQTFNLIPVLNVYENIEFPLIIQGVPAGERKKRVNALIEEVGLTEFVKHKPEELSGGQRQRIAVARALVTNPELVLADEPTANLDKENGLNILRMMKELNEHHGVTFVFSTHDQRVIDMAKRIIYLEDGKIVHK